ncbi:hypothetical protein D6T64_11895 [Cryobacterium melibiosiphilum]|uniref:Uncharacterized protein n=2 Tax=Cryobacterium melibiosiphilum TaxID=995039 RepID=A0A3A5MG47_9MICO|nr:hypothetical protein D6T64_11895 [Cryobacterium melibiosiphilum]
MTNTKHETTDYETIYNDARKAERVKHTADWWTDETLTAAGLAAVVTSAKREALADLLVQFPSHGLLGFKALIEKRLSEIEATQ